MLVAIIDYGSGNLRSAAKAVDRAARESGIAATVSVTDDAAVVARADRVILPGVGAFGDCRRGLDGVPHMVDTLRDVVLDKARPFLGICVGMQLMAERGLEHGSHAGLGWIPGQVEAIAPSDPTLKVPHMGWNALDFAADAHPVLAGIPTGEHAYFVHSYQLHCTESMHCLATVEYGGVITAVVGRDNMVGTQFHPEKSQAAGLALIANFLAWTP